MSKLTSEQWVELTKKTVEQYNEHKLRLGQAYMNSLYDVNKDLYTEITATENDPYYDNNKLIDFIYFLNQ